MIGTRAVTAVALAIWKVTVCAPASIVDAPTWSGTANAMMSVALLKAGSTTQVTVQAWVELSSAVTV